MQREETVQMKVDGQQLAGTLVAPDAPAGAPPTPGVLFVHGWGGNQQHYLTRARAAAALGCVCLAFDLRGHGRSDGRPERVSRADNLRDLLAAYDVLAGHPAVDPSRVAVVGSSYGGYLSAILTPLRPVRRLALRAPALYMDAGWELPKLRLNQDPDLRAFRRRLVHPAESRALAACAAFSGDVLLVESEHDASVPHPVIASYRAACGQARSLTHRVLPGADHGLSHESWQRAYGSILVNWLAEMTAGARAPAPEPEVRSAGDQED